MRVPFGILFTTFVSKNRKNSFDAKANIQTCIFTERDCDAPLLLHWDFSGSFSNSGLHTSHSSVADLYRAKNKIGFKVSQNQVFKSSQRLRVDDDVLPAVRYKNEHATMEGVVKVEVDSSV
jgi:hypothetical protein